jgi:hypothetical protein
MLLLLMLLLLQGRAYPASLFSVNYTTDIPYVLQEGRGPSGGEPMLLQVLHIKNLHSLCT